MTTETLRAVAGVAGLVVSLALLHAYWAILG